MECVQNDENDSVYSDTGSHFSQDPELLKYLASRGGAERGNIADDKTPVSSRSNSCSSNDSEDSALARYLACRGGKERGNIADTLGNQPETASEAETEKEMKIAPRKSAIVFLAKDKNKMRKQSHQDQADDAYARSCARNRQRRGAIQQGKDDFAQLMEIAALKTSRGLPCNPKNGKVSNLNLQELNYRERKIESLMQQSSCKLSPEQAKDLLMCKYLRLTDGNISSLKMNAMLGMLDTTFHPHLSNQQLESMYEDLLT